MLYGRSVTGGSTVTVCSLSKEVLKPSNTVFLL
uniref:Uncharacterized protein n=1 Tax=Aegilops tauschii subsp. strangulata TaxID=200361 RepID=A0A452Z195_AEGTS